MEVIFTDQNFQQKTAQGVVLVDFWAAWCGPCRMQVPILKEVAQEFESNSTVAIGTMNIDENPKTTQEFQIMSVPTLIIFKDGKSVERLNGFQPKETLVKKIKEHL